MNLEQSFLQTIRQRPGSVASRQVYEDWLIEQHNPSGEFIHYYISAHSLDQRRMEPWFDTNNYFTR
jgi:uncharacterized protein (TIGR02996 family)